MCTMAQGSHAVSPIKVFARKLKKIGRRCGHFRTKSKLNFPVSKSFAVASLNYGLLLGWSLVEVGYTNLVPLKANFFNNSNYIYTYTSCDSTWDLNDRCLGNSNIQRELITVFDLRVLNIALIFILFRCGNLNRFLWWSVTTVDK